MCAGVAPGGERNGMFTVVDAAQLSLGEIPAQRDQSSASAAAGIEDRKNAGGRLDRIRHVLPQRLVPPVVVLNGAHNVMFIRRHGTPSLAPFEGGVTGELQ